MKSQTPLPFYAKYPPIALIEVWIPWLALGFVLYLAAAMKLPYVGAVVLLAVMLIVASGIAYIVHVCIWHEAEYRRKMR